MTLNKSLPVITSATRAVTVLTSHGFGRVCAAGDQHLEHPGLSASSPPPSALRTFNFRPLRTTLSPHQVHILACLGPLRPHPRSLPNRLGTLSRRGHDGPRVTLRATVEFLFCWISRAHLPSCPCPLLTPALTAPPTPQPLDVLVGPLWPPLTTGNGGPCLGVRKRKPQLLKPEVQGRP